MNVKTKLDEWTDEHIIIAHKNGGLATLIYEMQCDYVGPNHSVICIEILKRVFDVLANKEIEIEVKDG